MKRTSTMPSKGFFHARVAVAMDGMGLVTILPQSSAYRVSDRAERHCYTFKGGERIEVEENGVFVKRTVHVRGVPCALSFMDKGLDLYAYINFRTNGRKTAKPVRLDKLGTKIRLVTPWSDG